MLSGDRELEVLLSLPGMLLIFSVTVNQTLLCLFWEGQED